MTAEVPDTPKEPMMTPQERRAEAMMNGSGFSQFDVVSRETGIWPEVPQELRIETPVESTAPKPRTRIHKPGDNFKGEGPDDDSSHDREWTEGLKQPRTVQEVKVIHNSIASILAERQAEERESRIAAGEKPEHVDADIRAKKIRKQRGYLG